MQTALALRVVSIYHASIGLRPSAQGCVSSKIRSRRKNRRSMIIAAPFLNCKGYIWNNDFTIAF